VSAIRQFIIGGALENAHLTYYLFKVYTIMHNFLTFDKLDILRYWLSSLSADSRVVLSDVLGGKDVVEGRDGRTDGRFCLLGIGRNGQIL
jgi:hypothetical protein